MEFQTVSNRIISQIQDSELIFGMTQMDILQSVEDSLTEDTSVAEYLTALLNFINVKDDDERFKQLKVIVLDLQANLDVIEGLKPYQYGLFQSGHPLDLLKTYTESNVVQLVLEAY